MAKNPINEAVVGAADPARAAAGFDRLRELGAWRPTKSTSANQARIFAALFSGSTWLADLLFQHPDWLKWLEEERLLVPRQEQAIQREVATLVSTPLAHRDYARALAELRNLKQREMLRIASRDLARLSNVPELTRELSNVADACLETVTRICQSQLSDRLGQPWHQEADGTWRRTGFAVIGLGKLGGQELNYSSDVDLLFVYSSEGFIFREPPAAGAPGRGMTSHQYFQRLAEAITGEVTRLAPEGTLYRVDLRLRPDGNSGPLARSLESYENFYAQWGQTWERMMLIKARPVAGDAELASEFLELVQPFRYPRSLSRSALQEITALKRRIEREVIRSGEQEREVKRGPGGIREIEFVAQTLQLLHAGRAPFLQGSQTLTALQNLARHDLLEEREARELAEAYVFLRDIEHRLQLEANQQTHTIPSERLARERLARLMNCESLAAFEDLHAAHRRRVRAVYERILKLEEADRAGDALPDFEADEQGWKRLLMAHGFRDPDRAGRLLKELALGPGYVHVTRHTTDLARQLIPRLLELCRAGKEPASLSDPDRVVARLGNFIAAYGARASLYETWTHNPNLFRLLLLLFDRSEFLAEVAIREPDLIDDLELSGRLRRSKTAEEILKDLRHGRDDEDQGLWLRRYHHAELMRLALREVLDLSGFEENMAELSALARACLGYSLEVILRKHHLEEAPVAIIGLGKLGGNELNYGSDLDLMLVTDAVPSALASLQRIGVELIALLSSRTDAGHVFETDLRLRPDGEKGLLVASIESCETYYQKRAQLWELQTLSRASFVAGNPHVGRAFLDLAARVTDFRQARAELAAWSPRWRQEIHHMRCRIERERTPAGQKVLAFKTGAGGLVDAEFIAQTLCLAHGWNEPGTLRALQRAEKCSVLEAADATSLIENYRQLRRLECVLRRWSFQAETQLPADPEAQFRVAVRCGFKDATSLLNAVTDWRKGIRAVYSKVFQPAGKSEA